MIIPEAPNECCKNDDNLIMLPTNRKDLVIRQCKICKCKHYEATMDPGIIGLEGAKL